MQIIWPNNLELANQFDKVSTFFWKAMDLQNFIGQLKFIRSNNLHNLEISWTADPGVM